MNREDTIRMARESMMRFADRAVLEAWLPSLERFAALVADAEREACAQVCESGWKLGIGEQYQGDVFATAIRARGKK
jgi:hypothetical protein